MSRCKMPSACNGRRAPQSAALAIVAAFAVLIAGKMTTAASRYVSHSEIQGVLQELAPSLPIELELLPALQEGAWETWISGHDSAIRARLAAGDEETIVNWLMFGTTFTSQPRGPAFTSSGLPQQQNALI